jgi:hypothetical protein
MAAQETERVVMTGLDDPRQILAQRLAGRSHRRDPSARAAADVDGDERPLISPAPG